MKLLLVLNLNTTIDALTVTDMRARTSTCPQKSCPMLRTDQELTEPKELTEHLAEHGEREPTGLTRAL